MLEKGGVEFLNCPIGRIGFHTSLGHNMHSLFSCEYENMEKEMGENMIKVCICVRFIMIIDCRVDYYVYLSIDHYMRMLN